MIPPVLNSNKDFIMINNNELFMNKYIEEIMPEITSTCKYISSKDDIHKIKKLNSKILKLQKDN
jgi:hypothetical protein